MSWKGQEYFKYFIKITFVLIILGIAFIIIVIYRINNELYTENKISFLYFFIMDFFIVILIPFVPIFLYLYNNFNKEKNQLKNLKSNLINIRYESSYKLIEKLGSEDDKKELLNNMILSKFKESFFTNPILINEIISKLRKFNIKPGNQISYADIFGFIIRLEGYKDLQGLDDVILKVYEVLNKYGVRKEYKRIIKGLGSFNDNLLDEIDELLKQKDYNYLRNLLLTDLDWVLIYNYHKKKPSPLTLYRKDF